MKDAEVSGRLDDRKHSERFADQSRDPGLRDQEVRVNAWRQVAKQIKDTLSPLSVVVLGGAHSFLVEAFREIGIEAYGVEFCGQETSRGKDRLQPYSFLACAAEPLPLPTHKRFDLITCFEVLEHLSEAEATEVMKTFTKVSDLILFSARSDDLPEPTHVQGHPPEYWISQFENLGYALDLSYDAAFVGSPAFLFRSRRYLEYTFPRPLRVVVLSSVLDNACGEVRLLRPLSYLERDGLVETRAFQDDKRDPPPFDHLDWADILILQRVKSLRWRPYVKYAGRKRIPIVYEIDDNLLELPSAHPESKSWLLQRIKNAKYSWYLRHAHAVTTSTRSLADYLRRFNSNIYLLRNYVDVASRPSAAQEKISPQGNQRVLTIGYAGSSTHAYDFQPLLAPLKRLIALFDDRVRLLFLGYAPPELGKESNFIIQEGMVSYGQYLRELREAKMDVAVAPLLNNLFNECKSNLKYLEYAMAGIPGIFSRVGPYRETIQHGITGILVDENTEEQWLDALRFALQNPDRLKAMGRTAEHFVRCNFLLQDHYREWWDTYVSILLSVPDQRR